MLAIDTPPRVEGLHADVIEIGAAMYGRERVGLREDQEFGVAGALAQFSSQPHGARSPAAVSVAQDTEPRARYRHELVFACAANEPVATITEQHEVLRFHPFEQRARLGDLVRGERCRVPEPR